MEKCNDNYSVYFPDLPGCVTSGDTVAQAIEMAKEALQFHLWGMEEDGEEKTEKKFRQQVNLKI